MGCQASVYIGDNLAFTIATHDPDTGVLTDADDAPIYRIYEDETAVPILTGTMAILDNANTTGFYSELIACTAANGFEDGKSYNIYIEATVDGDTGGICFGFRAETPIWSTAVRTLTAASGAVGTEITGSAITLHRGDSFSVAITGLGDISARTKLWFTAKTAPLRDVDSEAIIQIEETAGLLFINGAIAAVAVNGSIIVEDEIVGNIRVILDEAETDDLHPNLIYYDVQMLDATDVTTVTESTLTISEDVTRAIT